MNTRTRPLTLCRVVAAAAPLALAGLCAMALPAAALNDGPGDPAGNNGTLKVTSHGEDDGIPQSTPHVSCDFDLEWYGFDEGAHVISQVEFTMDATSDADLSLVGPSEVFVGGDPAGGAGNDFDGEATYHLGSAYGSGALDPVRVKVTIRTPGAQGADTKHKAFWVQPCEDETPPPPLNL